MSSNMMFKIRQYANLSGYPTYFLMLAQTRFESWYTDATRRPPFLYQQLLGGILPNIREMQPHRVPVTQLTVKKVIVVLSRIEGYESRDVNQVIVRGVSRN